MVKGGYREYLSQAPVEGFTSPPTAKTIREGKAEELASFIDKLLSP